MKIDSTPLNDNRMRSNLLESNELMKKLASGKRVNSAADDAAGLQIINRLTSQFNAADQGIRNLYDGISLAQTADGTLAGVSDSLQQLKTLNVQAGNGIYNASDLAALQDQATQIGKGINEQLSRSSFAGQKLFDGGNQFNFVTAAGNVALETADLTAQFNSTGLNNIDVQSASGRANLQSSLENFSKLVQDNRASLGAGINSFTSSINNQQTQAVNLAAARSRIEDLDYAKASSDKAASDVLQQSSLAVRAQSRISAERALQLLG
jgi:flagellin